MLIIDIFLIVFLITVIWDISGFMFDFQKIVYEKINKKPYMGQQLPKLISCSYCVKFHAVWLYLMLNDVNLLYAFSAAAALSFVGVVMKQLLSKLYEKINKI